MPRQPKLPAARFEILRADGLSWDEIAEYGGYASGNSARVCYANLKTRCRKQPAAVRAMAMVEDHFYLGLPWKEIAAKHGYKNAASANSVVARWRRERP